MPSPEYAQHRAPVFYTRLARMLAACVILAGAIALYCGHAGLTPIAIWFPAMPTLKANTAAGLLCAGAALWLQSWNASRARRFTTGAAQLLALAALLIGAATLIQDLYNVDLQIDQMLFSARPDGAAAQPGRMSPLAALALILAGAGLLLLDWKTSEARGARYPAEYCAVLIAGLMSIPLIGYLYSVTAMFRASSSAGIGPHAALLFVMLAAGMLAARPGHRIMALWSNDAPGGHLLRRLLPKSLLLLIVLDLLVEWGARKGIYGRQNVSPLVILLASAWLSVLFWRAASMLNNEFDVRRKGETALLETSALLRAVSDNTPDPIFVKDREGRVVFANPAAFRMLGKDAAGVIGRRNRDIFADAGDAEQIDAHDRLVIAGGKPDAVEETVRLSNGVRTFYTVKAPWFNERREVVGMVGISTDITERKKMEDALKAHETQLEGLVAARTAEVSELIGHLESTREEEKRAIARELHDDLGSALTALNMHLAILFQQMPAEPRLTERSVQIKALLNSVTQTTRRIQLGLRPDKLDIFGIKTAIAEQALEFENYTGVVCHTSLPDEDLTYAPQLDIAVYRMVQEALNNIAKHANATRADIILDDTEECVTLTIRDNGVGMASPQPAGMLTHGLRGMRERAGYLGGEVKIISAPGKGTCIIISIPKNISTAHNPPGAGAPHSTAADR